MSDLCPAVSASGLTCDKDDDYDEHKTLSHRNDEQEREWPISNSDRVRWGVVQEKRKKTVATVGVEETSDADVTTKDPTQLEEKETDSE